MKKSVKVLIGLVAGATIFTAGISASASLDWLNSVLEPTHSRVHTSAQQTTNKLVGQLEGSMDQIMLDVSEPRVRQIESNIDAELEKYYQARLSELTDSANYQELSGHLDKIEQQAIEHYKKQIDAAFDE